MSETVRIPVIEGDGSGGDIWRTSRKVLNAAMLRAYGEAKTVEWVPVMAGLRALESEGSLLPERTVEAIRDAGVAIKGPLTTPVGGGFRSVNVYLRQVFDLYACVRPVRYLPGLPSPLKSPEKVDLIILRENTEDIYRGIEWQEGSDGARSMIDFLKTSMNTVLPADSGIGVKPISRGGTRRFVEWAIDYAIRNGRRSITVVHKGNIMKYTEGAFREWAYETAGRYPDRVSFEPAEKRILFNDRIADNMFMQIILQPEDYDILLCPNLNGDYLSDACAALIGGLGVAPGANIGDKVAIFEPTHGTAPKYAGLDVANPTSFILSGAMMFRYLGLQEAAEAIESAVAATVKEGILTYDLARQIDGKRPVRCSEFGEAVARRIE